MKRLWFPFLVFAVLLLAAGCQAHGNDFDDEQEMRPGLIAARLDELDRASITAPPFLCGLRLNTTSVDVSNGEAFAMLSVDVCKDWKGEARAVHAELTSASSGKKMTCRHMDIELGQPIDCLFRVARYQSAGQWKLTHIGFHDRMEAHHFHGESLRRVEKVANVTLQVQSDEDVTPPMIRNLTLRAEIVNGEPKLVSNLSIEDDRSGFEHAMLFLLDGKGEPKAMLMYSRTNIVEGSETHGTFAATTPFHKHVAGGDWLVKGMQLFDRAHNMREIDVLLLNSLNLPTSVHMPTTGDIVAPQLHSIQVRERSIFPGSMFHFDLVSSDELSGIIQTVIKLRHVKFHDAEVINGAVLQKAATGEVPTVVTIYIPYRFPPGEYRIVDVIILDEVNNRRTYTVADIERENLKHNNLTLTVLDPKDDPSTLKGKPTGPEGTAKEDL